MFKKTNKEILFNPFLKISLDDDYGLSSDLLELKWKIMTDYFPLMGEDYVYEGADVPEGEMLIDQIQVMSAPYP